MGMPTESRLLDVLPVPRPPQEVRPLTRWLSRAIPGVAATVAQIGPYATWWDDHNQRTSQSARSTPWWIVMGDSAAQGIGATHPLGGWVGQLDQLLIAADRPHRLLNLSVSGARTSDLINVQLPRYEAFLREMGSPALTIVEIGSNDAFGSANIVAIRRNLSIIAERLPSGTVLTTLPSAGPSAIARMSNTTIWSLSKRHQLVVADINRHYRPRRDRLGSDAFHPNELGYSEWTRAIAESIGLETG